LTELKLLECHRANAHDVQLVVDRLPKLTHLSILHHRLAELTLSNLPLLTYLCLYDCVKLVRLRELPRGLLELNLANCSALTGFSELSRLVRVQNLNLWGTMVRALPNLAALQALNVSNCNNLTDDGLLSVLPCPHLHSVFAHGCERLSPDLFPQSLTKKKLFL
jgi:hypothetical protein